MVNYHQMALLCNSTVLDNFMDPFMIIYCSSLYLNLHYAALRSHLVQHERFEQHCAMQVP